MDLIPEQSLSTENAALSRDNKYFYVGLSNSAKSLESCSLAGVTAGKGAPTPEPAAAIPEISTIKEDECNATAADLKRNSTKNNDSPKLNFMSLVVTCLRIVFAKTVAFNVLITLKAAVF